MGVGGVSSTFDAGGGLLTHSFKHTGSWRLATGQMCAGRLMDGTLTPPKLFGLVFHAQEAKSSICIYVQALTLTRHTVTHQH